MLKKDTAQQFDIKTPNLPIVGYYGVHFGTIDLSTLTVHQANYLVNNGFPHLRRRDNQTPDTPTIVPSATLISEPQLVDALKETLATKAADKKSN